MLLKVYHINLYTSYFNRSNKGCKHHSTNNLESRILYPEVLQNLLSYFGGNDDALFRLLALGLNLFKWIYLCIAMTNSPREYCTSHFEIVIVRASTNMVFADFIARLVFAF